MIVTSDTQSKKLAMPQYNEKQLIELLVELIITAEIHFFTIEGKGFHKLENAIES